MIFRSQKRQQKCDFVILSQSHGEGEKWAVKESRRGKTDSLIIDEVEDCIELLTNSFTVCD